MQRKQHQKWISATKVLLAVLFLTSGCCIYLFFRSKNLNIYQWSVSLGISDIVDSCRRYVQDYSIPDFVRFSLPDGLYCAAYILLMDVIWSKEKCFAKYFIMSLVPVITIASEFLQYVGLLRGTFDALDLVCYTTPPLVYSGILITNQFMYNKLKTKDL